MVHKRDDVLSADKSSRGGNNEENVRESESKDVFRGAQRE